MWNNSQSPAEFVPWKCLPLVGRCLVQVVPFLCWPLLFGILLVFISSWVEWSTDVTETEAVGGVQGYRGQNHSQTHGGTTLFQPAIKTVKGILKHFSFPDWKCWLCLALSLSNLCLMKSTCVLSADLAWLFMTHASECCVDVVLFKLEDAKNRYINIYMDWGFVCVVWAPDRENQSCVLRCQ